MVPDDPLDATPYADPRVGIVVFTYIRVAEVTRTLVQLMLLPNRIAQT